MSVFLTGGTGFIGRHLYRMLLANKFSVTVATRNPDRHTSDHDGLQFVPLSEDMTEFLDGSRIVINLAGENLIGKRWSKRVKQRIYDSRILTTRSLVSAMKQMDRKPDVFISGSAVGYYGHCGNDEVTEQRGPGDDYLASICREWEATAREAENLGVRVVNPRTGVTLGRNGGALAIMLPVFEAFLGGSVGPGSQYFPWIHIDDFCRSILFAIQTEDMDGPYNAVAPDTVTMDEFTNTLGAVLSRPSIFKIPKFGINMLFGEEAAVMLTASMKVIPQKISQHGFTYSFSKLRPALEHLLKK